MEHRPLEGFVYAVTPFNFTAIGGNLPGAPALMGNTAVWKPSHAALLSNYYVYRLLETAGLPPGVINFVPAEPVMCTATLVEEPYFAGIHFTGSTAVFRQIWHQVASRLDKYVSYPRIVGETGGKDFVVAHQSADAEAVAVGLVRGAYEYQGQKCSAASRAYIPDTLWPEVRDRMVAMIADIRMGDVADFRNFMGAVIDRKAFDRIKGYLDAAKIGTGRQDHCRRRHATTRRAGSSSPHSSPPRTRSTGSCATSCSVRSMTVHVYPAGKWRETLNLVNGTSPYALTGCGVRARSGGAGRGEPGAAERGGQLLPQRQAHWGGGGPAALRRCARERHQRQGGVDPQPGALGVAAQHQGDARLAHGLSLSVHGGGVAGCEQR